VHWIQIRVRESRFGLALVVESSLGSGGYVLGFQLDPIERLHKVSDDLQNLYRVHSEHPELGIYYSVTNAVGVQSILYSFFSQSDITP
jgi:Bardet-Biedl syndrome 5 protein